MTYIQETWHCWEIEWIGSCSIVAKSGSGCGRSFVFTSWWSWSLLFFHISNLAWNTEFRRINKDPISWTRTTILHKSSKENLRMWNKQLVLQSHMYNALASTKDKYHKFRVLCFKSSFYEITIEWDIVTVPLIPFWNVQATLGQTKISRGNVR